LASGIQGALSFCEEEGFKPCSVEVENVDTGQQEVINIASGAYSQMDVSTSISKDDTRSVLYIKDKFSISNEAFHELSMVSNLPNSSKIKTLTHTLNSEFEIRSAPNGVGAQQSVRARIMVEKAPNPSDVPSTIRIKLTGDGTQIARGLSVVNIGFTVLEEGKNRACSAYGNYSIAMCRKSTKN
jgi:hypothetical protein